MDTNSDLSFISRAAFDQLVSEFLSSRKPKQQRKAIITQKDYDLIISILKNPKDMSNGTAKDRFWAKNNFYLHDLGTPHNPIIQLMEIKNAKERTDRVICPFQNLYNVLGKMHGSSQQHSGSKKTYEAVSRQYAYVPRSFVELYVAQCTQCCTRRNFPAPIIGKTIISKKFLQRVQIDLVSFEKYLDKEYHYIAHLRDHFSQFSWTCPLCTKEASEVSAFLFSVFTVFGPPCILQSDNGREFTVQVIYELVSLWKGVHIINGCPRHPQSQGLVENANKTLKNALSTWMEDNQQRDWSVGLPIVTYAMNIRHSRPTKYTPYELVFGQHPL
ncbi:10397_t:CDS:1 [Dentiscutata heterogama]|uniref:10397_t:CDS:1 n=1 Tax=Dentiscutata heterogama TaxID=1316150 RepID=A0ACA9MKF2_9GLOM|nr:10397_t:CDS:1 [Dentiscutata heterogama]